MGYINPYENDSKVKLEPYALKVKRKDKSKGKRKAKKEPYDAECFDPNEYKTHAYRTKYE